MRASKGCKASEMDSRVAFWAFIQSVLHSSCVNCRSEGGGRSHHPNGCTFSAPVPAARAGGVRRGLVAGRIRPARSAIGMYWPIPGN